MQVDTGFTTKYPEGEVAFDATPTPIESREPGPFSSREAPVEESAVRLFVNDRMNSRQSHALGSNVLAAAAHFDAEPTFAPAYLVESRERVAVQGQAAWQILDSGLNPVRRLTGGAGHVILFEDEGIAYVPDQVGLLTAYSLVEGKEIYSAPLIYGSDFERTWFTRRGSRLFVASVEKMVDPHSDQMPELSTLEVAEVGELEFDGLGTMITAPSQANLIRKAQWVVAATSDETIVTGFEDHLFLMDWDLRIHQDFTGEFLPISLSLDEAGAMYLCVEERDSDDRPSFWVVQPDGGRTVQFPLEKPCQDLIAPPIVGYEHTAHLLSKDGVIAVAPSGEARWARSAEGGFAGAVVTADDQLVASDGNQLVAFDQHGQRRVLFESEEPLVTPPLLTGPGEVLVASPSRLYKLVPGGSN